LRMLPHKIGRLMCIGKLRKGVFYLFCVCGLPIIYMLLAVFLLEKQNSTYKDF